MIFHRKTVATLVCLACTIASSVCSGAKLKLHLTFDQIKGNCTYDEVKGLKAELHNVKKVKGKFGYGLFFNGIENRGDRKKGGSYVVLPTTKEISFFQDFSDKAFTIEVWIKPSRLKSYKVQQNIISTAGGRGPGYRLFYSWRVIKFLSGTGKKTWYISSQDKNEKFDKVKIDTWNHIAVVRSNAGIASIYINGEKKSENIYKNKIQNSNSKFKIRSYKKPLTIGSLLSGYAYTFHGVIDDVKIYEGAKSPDEIILTANKE